ncbi:MAG TPA: hypothetical protein VHP30_15105, partial [Ignavibacteriales bacterium]|nr:hypothetical protein [Ignavibacteriales bacterium]
MKKYIMLALLLASGIASAQDSSYVYTGSIDFPVPDSLVAPFLCATDSQGALWVVSTNTTNAKAENSLFKAAPGDETMTLVKVFGTGDSVRNISGITAVGADIFVSARMSAPAGEASPAYYPYSQMFYFPNG